MAARIFYQEDCNLSVLGMNHLNRELHKLAEVFCRFL